MLQFVAPLRIARPSPAILAQVDTALYRTLSDLGLVIGPVLLGWMVDVSGYGLAFWTNAALLLVTTVAFGLLARESAGRRVMARRRA